MSVKHPIVKDQMSCSHRLLVVVINIRFGRWPLGGSTCRVILLSSVRAEPVELRGMFETFF